MRLSLAHSGLGAALCLAAALTTSMARATDFPPQFRWCVATSAHQIEGANTNSDWWAFEAQGKVHGHETSGQATGHWKRVAGDTQLIKELGANTYRLSVEWAKIEPSEGVFDMEALEHYRQELSGLRAAGIEPLVTLHHFTLPLWLANKGGWAWPGIVAAFARYTQRVYEALGEGVSTWVTINEPMVVVANGYFLGLFPPAKNDIHEAIPPLRHMLQAHAAAYHKLHAAAKAKGRTIQVGVAHHFRIFDAASGLNPLDHLMRFQLDRLFNGTFVNALADGRLRVSLPFTIDVDEIINDAKDTQDFIGVNYYTRDMVTFVLKGPLFLERRLADGAAVSDLGWEIYPEGLYRLVKDMAQRFPGKPIMVTENGLADAKDAKRAAFLVDHLRALHKAMQEGVPVIGYCHWSLLDNFEWVEGFGPRFGLYAVDYSTLARQARPSAQVFRRIATSGNLSP